MTCEMKAIPHIEIWLTSYDNTYNKYITLSIDRMYGAGHSKKVIIWLRDILCKTNGNIVVATTQAT